MLDAHGKPFCVITRPNRIRVRKDLPLVPVAPCDEPAVIRVAQTLASQHGWDYDLCGTDNRLWLVGRAIDLLQAAATLSDAS